VATYRAIEATCKATIYLLKSNYKKSLFENGYDPLSSPMEFEVYSTANFLTPMEAGISLFLYRILPNGTFRTPPGRIGPNGERYDTKLPLDLHFLLTAWAKEASLQQALLGWMMRILEDTPILPYGLLERSLAGVFQPDEAVEIVLAELNTEDLLHIWETLPHANYQLSVAYMARNVRLESSRASAVGRTVQKRRYDYQKVENGNHS
jgi:hypothetical protein